METSIDSSEPIVWRQAFMLLTSLDLQTVQTWQGPDSIDEIKLRVESLAFLLGIVPRYDVGRLDEVVKHLAESYPIDAVPELYDVRRSVRRLLAAPSFISEPDSYTAQAVQLLGQPPANLRPSPAPRADGEDVQEGYLNCLDGMGRWLKLLSESRKWTHVNVSFSESGDFPLEEIFVETYSVSDEHIQTSQDQTSEQLQGKLGRISTESHPVIDAVTMLARASELCIVVGDPGSGKSTLAKWLAHGVATKQNADFDLPIFISLGTFSLALSALPSLTLLEHFFQSLELAPEQSIGASQWLRESAKKSGRILLLLDGWDEVPPALREQVHSKISTEAQYFTTLITSRPSGFPKRLAMGRRADLFHIAGLSKTGRKSLVQRYLKAQSKQDQLDHVLQRIESHPELKDFACNPFMLGFLTQALTSAGKGRQDSWTLADLYELAAECIVETSAERRPEAPAQLARSLSRFHHLSFKLLFRDRIPRYLFSYSELFSTIDRGDETAILQSRFINRVDRLGHSYAFIHATFQEYFAAKYLDRVNQDELQMTLDRAFFSASRNMVLEFLAGLDSIAGQACRSRLSHFASRPDRYGQIVLRTARLLASCPPAKRSDELTKALGAKLWKLICSNRDMDLKARAISIYGRLDPVGLCQAIRSEREPDQFVLDAIVSSVPANIVRTQRIADLMDPAMRERVEAELLFNIGPAEIEANRAVLENPSANEEDLRDAILFAGSTRDLGAVHSLGCRLRVIGLTDELQSEIATTLGLIGGEEAARLLVDMVTGSIRVSTTAAGLSRRGLQHIEGGHQRLNPAGRDALMRRVACTRTDNPQLIRMLSALNGMPVRTGLSLLQYWFKCSDVPSFVRFECLQILERSLPNSEFDRVLESISDMPSDIEALLLSAAVQRKRPLPIGWLVQRLEASTRFPDKAMLITVTLASSQTGTETSAAIEDLLAQTFQTALLSTHDRDNDLAEACQRALADFPLERDTPRWIDSDLCARMLRDFCDRKRDIPSSRVMLAATLMGRVRTRESIQLLNRCLAECHVRTRQRQHEMQIALLNEVARSIAKALAEVDPQSLLRFATDWEPVRDLLHTLSNQRGWLVFEDAILDSEGQALLDAFADSSNGASDNKLEEARESSPMEDPNIIKLGKLLILPEQWVRVDGQPGIEVALGTNLSHKILVALAKVSAKGNWLNADKLTEIVWGPNAVVSDSTFQRAISEARKWIHKELGAWISFPKPAKGLGRYQLEAVIPAT